MTRGSTPWDGTKQRSVRLEAQDACLSRIERRFDSGTERQFSSTRHPRVVMDKKHQQLGMNPSTAQQRLVKDLLFKLATDAGHACHHCKQSLTRDTFSIEHKKPWLDSAEPRKLFFDLSNIAFSHQECNFRAARREKKWPSIHTRNKVAGAKRTAWVASLPETERKALRHAQYLRAKQKNQ
jgi:hypothetical protein